MLVTLSVLRGGRSVEAWFTGGKQVVHKPKVPPYFWSTDKEAIGERLQRRLLSDPTKQVELIKVDCRNVYDVKHVSRQLLSAYETEVRYKERLAQDCGFKQSDAKTTNATFDVEAVSKGQFPRADRDPIRAIAFYSRRRQMVWTTFDDPEYEIIAKLCDSTCEENVDVFGTFSGTAFDYDYPAQRAVKLGVDFPLGRRGDAPYTKTRMFESGKRVGVDKTTFLKGRLCFDLYKEVLFDSSLSGIRHTLKDTCRYMFGDPYILEVDRQRLDQLTRDEVGAYCFSDARITYKLLEHYLSILKPLALILRVPLDMLTTRKPSHIGNLVYGREFNKLGIISDGSNFNRFKSIFGWMDDEQDNERF